jgi:hypothetical protein
VKEEEEEAKPIMVIEGSDSDDSLVEQQVSLEEDLGSIDGEYNDEKDKEKIVLEEDEKKKEKQEETKRNTKVRPMRGWALGGLGCSI